MTVSSNDRRIQYTATSGQTVFPYDFPIAANTEIEVKQTVDATGITSTLTLTTDYTVSDVGEASGGDITLVTGAATDDIITITGATPLTRTTDFSNAGDFLASDLNDQLDTQLKILQESDTTTSRAILLADEDTSASLTLPTATNRASKFLAFDASGDAIASAGTTEVAVSSFMETVLDDTTAAAARTTLSAQEDVITTRGDLVKGSSTAVAERLAVGSANQILTSDGTDPSWSDDLAVNGKFNGVKNTATIASGSVAYSGVYMEIDTESAASTDDLDTITGGAEGDILILRITDASRNVVVKHGTGAGNVNFGDASDVTLDFINDSLILQHDGTVWRVISREVVGDFSSSKASPGYTYLPNGLLMQWGLETAVGGNTTSAVTLPVTYATSHLVAYASIKSTVNYDEPVQAVNTSTSQITVRNSNAGSCDIQWLSIGY